MAEQEGLRGGEETEEGIVSRDFLKQKSLERKRAIQVLEVNQEQTGLAGATATWFRVSREGAVCQKGSLQSWLRASRDVKSILLLISKYDQNG